MTRARALPQLWPYHPPQRPHYPVYAYQEEPVVPATLTTIDTRWITNATTSVQDNVWNIWVDQGTQATQGVYYETATRQRIWQEWVHQADLGQHQLPSHRQQQTRQQLVQRNRTRAAQLRRKLANRRAEELLLECLDEKQRAKWRDRRCFDVETADGRRRYRIRHGVAGNITLVRLDGAPPVPVGANGVPIRQGAQFCMHCYPPASSGASIPVADHMLAQKLLIEANETEFLALANVS